MVLSRTIPAISRRRVAVRRMPRGQGAAAAFQNRRRYRQWALEALGQTSILRRETDGGRRCVCLGLAPAVTRQQGPRSWETTGRRSPLTQPARGPLSDWLEPLTSLEVAAPHRQEFSVPRPVARSVSKRPQEDTRPTWYRAPAGALGRAVPGTSARFPHGALVRLQGAIQNRDPFPEYLQVLLAVAGGFLRQFAVHNPGRHLRVHNVYESATEKSCLHFRPRPVKRP